MIEIPLFVRLVLVSVNSSQDYVLAHVEISTTGETHHWHKTGRIHES
jgi:hypothetical protein